MGSTRYDAHVMSGGGRALMTLVVRQGCGAFLSKGDARLWAHSHTILDGNQIVGCAE